jgi:hypothetical protein
VEGIGSAPRQTWLVYGDDPSTRQRASSQEPTNAWLTPILKQFAALTIEDFAQCPVWIACHVADYDEPWYDDTDEETFRPYGGETSG